MIGCEIMKGFDPEALSLSDQLIEIAHVIEIVFVSITVGESFLELFQGLGVIGILRECFPEILKVGVDKRDNVIFGFLSIRDL